MPSRPNKRSSVRYAVTAALAAAILAVPATALAAPTTTSFSDPSSDAPPAIDITQATISSDAEAISFSFRLRDVDAANPLTAYAPGYAFTFQGPVDRIGGRPSGTAITRFGNANETRLDVIPGGATRDGGETDLTAVGTRTRNVVTNTVTMRFARTDFRLSGEDPEDLSPGTVLTSLGARADYQQDFFSRSDTAAAPAGTAHTVGG